MPLRYPIVKGARRRRGQRGPATAMAAIVVGIAICAVGETGSAGAHARQVVRGNADTGSARVSEMSDRPRASMVQDAQMDQIATRRATNDRQLRADATTQVAADTAAATRGTPPAQVPGNEAQRPTVPQLSPRERVTNARQMYTGNRTAQPASPLSSTGQSAPQAVVRLQGADRCDDRVSGREPDVCARAIETRSAEFARPSPAQLSPEQRLLIDQRIRAAPIGSDLAARRLAEGLDENSLESQGVASVVLSAEATVQQSGRTENPSAQLGGFDQSTLEIIRGIAEGLGASIPTP